MIRIVTDGRAPRPSPCFLPHAVGSGVSRSNPCRGRLYKREITRKGVNGSSKRSAEE
jgi:hypothetical protein